MFENFQNNYLVDNVISMKSESISYEYNIPHIKSFFDRFGGRSFEKGLYRIINPSDLDLWKDRIREAFPQFSEKLLCFGYDWAGSVFALDFNRFESGLQGVALLEVGTGEILRTPYNIISFHNKGLIENKNALLNSNFFKDWKKNGGNSPNYDQCVGYRKPLFLNGQDSVENLEISDVDVYWHIMGQLIQKVRHLPVGTKVNVDLEN